ncbi:MAG: winged helix-turn-helix domain-containing protein [Longimicrobiales bacterium]
MRPLRITADAARRMMVAALGLARRPRRKARKQDVLEAIRALGVLQIDTINVVARSPYLVLFSRLGAYERRWLGELLAQGALFEYWAHEASFLPIEDYPLFRHRMIDPSGLGWKYSHAWVEQNRAAVDRVLAQIRANGGVRSADFDRRRDGKGGGWWGWKPEKRALEMLFTAGELMIARRENFQRVYDLRERVHPSWDDASLPPRDEVMQQLALRAVHALGISRAHWVGDYFRTDRRAAAVQTCALAEAGELEEVEVEGWRDVAYVHPERRELLEEAVAGRLRPTLTTFLSPFDPLIWDRARALEVFGFDYRLECYTPAPKRIHGYFVLPLLRRGRLIGRLDAKAHRRAGEFEAKRISLEPGVRATDVVVNDIARALAELAAWHGTPAVRVGQVEPDALRAPLGRALVTAG